MYCLYLIKTCRNRLNLCFPQDIHLKTDFVFTGDDGKIICVSVVVSVCVYKSTLMCMMFWKEILILPHFLFHYLNAFQPGFLLSCQTNHINIIKMF